MDYIHISDSERVVEGLDSMMQEAFAPDGWKEVHTYMPIEDVLLILVVARRVSDNPKWFVRGKWATIQELERKVDEQLDAAIAAKGK